MAYMDPMGSGTSHNPANWGYPTIWKPTWFPQRGQAALGFQLLRPQRQQGLYRRTADLVPALKHGPGDGSHLKLGC